MELLKLYHIYKGDRQNSTGEHMINLKDIGMELTNIKETDNAVEVKLKELVGVVDFSREYFLRNKALKEKLTKLYPGKKIKIEII